MTEYVIDDRPEDASPSETFDGPSIQAISNDIPLSIRVSPTQCLAVEPNHFDSKTSTYKVDGMNSSFIVRQINTSSKGLHWIVEKIECEEF